MAESDEEAKSITGFLTSNRFPFHMRTEHSEQTASEAVESGRFWSTESAGYWVRADGTTIGMVVLDDLADDTPMFDLRLAEEFRGRGLGVQVLRELCTLVFEKFPEPVRFEGQTREDNIAMRRTFLQAGFVKEAHYRMAWPTKEGTRMASVAYAILRPDWENNATTPLVWDDLPLTSR